MLPPWPDWTPAEWRRRVAALVRKYSPDQDRDESGRFSTMGGGGTAQASTPAFKAWFGDSKIVDAQGEPLVVYHGTNADPSTFRPYTHFGTSAAANDRAGTLEDFSVNVVGRDPGAFQVMPVYLKIENPLRMPDLVSIDAHTGEPLDEVQAAFDRLDPETRDRRESSGEEPRGRSWEGEGDVPDTLVEMGVITRDEFWDVQYHDDKAFALLKTKGYDGIVYNNVVEDIGQDSYIIFDPSQVKSALGNRGTFDARRVDVAKTG